MATLSKDTITEDGIFYIRDTSMILGSLFTMALASIVYFGIVYFFVSSAFESTEADIGSILGAIIINAIILLILGIIPLLMSFKLAANWNGTEFNLSDRTVEFPGGNAKANDVIDYVKPSFWFQALTRHAVDLDSITHTEYANEGVRISGTFGTTVIPMNDSGKCDQIMSALVSMNQMGSPVVIN